MSGRMLALIAGAVIALGVAGAAEAHPGHASCAGGAPAALALLAPDEGWPGPGFGTDFVSPLATSGQAATTVASIHSIDAVCTQK